MSTIISIVRIRPNRTEPYVATCDGKTASSTSGEFYAAQKAALKSKTGSRTAHLGEFDRHGITLRKVTTYTYIAEWENQNQ